jgi:hypothetical protein
VEHNDGEFEVVMLSDKHRRRLHNHIKHWQEGKPKPPQFGQHHGSRLQIEWTGFPIHIDDKIWPKKASQTESARNDRYRGRAEGGDVPRPQGRARRAEGGREEQQDERTKTTREVTLRYKKRFLEHYERK